MVRNRRTKVFIMGFYGRLNFGDDVMARALSRHIVSVTDADVAVAADGDYIADALSAPRIRVVPRKLTSILGELVHCDVLIQGGGTIFHDSYVGAARRRYCLNLAAWLVLFSLARLLGSRVLVLGAWIGPWRS